jgi:DNA-binding NtrC family response regulator
VSAPYKFRVLVVDDEAAVLLTYRLILEQQGYEVMACSTSVEAIKAVEQQSFDVVLCDYSLEEQHTGFEVITAARSRNPEVPAALLTGYATKDTADEAQSRGIGIMFKPIEIDEFLATTSNMARKKDESKQKDG